MTPALLEALRWVLPIFMGLIVYEVSRAALNASVFIDDLPIVVKRVGVVAIAGGLSVTLMWLHLTTPEECTPLVEVSANVFMHAVRDCATAINTKAPLQAFAAAGVAMVIHALKKSSPRT